MSTLDWTRWNPNIKTDTLHVIGAGFGLELKQNCVSDGHSARSDEAQTMRWRMNEAGKDEKQCEKEDGYCNAPLRQHRDRGSSSPLLIGHTRLAAFPLIVSRSK